MLWRSALRAEFLASRYLACRSVGRSAGPGQRRSVLHHCSSKQSREVSFARGSPNMQDAGHRAPLGERPMEAADRHHRRCVTIESHPQSQIIAVCCICKISEKQVLRAEERKSESDIWSSGLSPVRRPIETAAARVGNLRSPPDPAACLNRSSRQRSQALQPAGRDVIVPRQQGGRCLHSGGWGQRGGGGWSGAKRMPHPSSLGALLAPRCPTAVSGSMVRRSRL